MHCALFILIRPDMGCDLSSGKITTSHLEKEMNTEFEMSVVSTFLVSTSSPVRYQKPVKHYCGLFLLLLLQHKEHYLQNKTYTTYNTTYNTLLILHYLLYNTSLDYDFNTTFIQFVFRLHTYVPSKLQFETGFHLASSIFTLLY